MENIVERGFLVRSTTVLDFLFLLSLFFRFFYFFLSCFFPAPARFCARHARPLGCVLLVFLLYDCNEFSLDEGNKVLRQ